MGRIETNLINQYLIRAVLSEVGKLARRLEEDRNLIA
jgi:hypothetical protein